MTEKKITTPGPDGLRFKIRRLENPTVSAHEQRSAYLSSPPLKFVVDPPKDRLCERCSAKALAEIFILAAELERIDPVRHRAVYEVLTDVEEVFGKEGVYKWAPEFLRRAIERAKKDHQPKR